MNLAQLIQKAFLVATGKPDMPEVGSAKFNRLLSLANIYKDDWASESGVDWASLYVEESAGTVATTMSVPLGMRKLATRGSDKPYILKSDGTRVYLNISSPDNMSDRSVAKVGQTLKLTAGLVADMAGGELYVQGYTGLPDLVDLNDEILVDNPNWLVYMTASGYDFNDTVKRGNYADCVALAANIMASMKSENSVATEVDRSWSAEC